MDKNFPRLLDTLTVVQRTDRLSTPEIRERLAARGHRVTARTVQRDLEALATVYPIACDMRSRPYAWRWRANAPRLSLPGMDWPEAISFHLLASYLDGVLPPSLRDGIRPYIDEARRKLAQRFDQLPLRRWPERVRVLPGGPPLLPPKVLPAVQWTVTEAILLGRRVRLRYQAFDAPEARVHTVAALGLVQSGAVFYVPVRFDGHDDVRTIVLHRVLRAEMLDEPSGIEAFDLDAWIAQGAMGFGGGEPIRLVLHLYEGLGELLRETPLARDQVIEDLGGGVRRLTATVLETAELRRWLLSLGARVETVAPSSLRGIIAAELQESAATHSRQTVSSASR